jgi:hypothetical protein
LAGNFFAGKKSTTIPSCAMKKIKIIIGVLVVLFVLFVVAVLMIGAHLGDLVKAGLEVAGPKVTQTTLTVDAVNISLLAGSASVKNLVLGNPAGYQAPQSLCISNTAISLVPGSVWSDRIVIHSVEVRALDITFEGNPFGANNLTQIMANVDGAAGSASGGNNAPAAAPAGPAKPARTYEVDDLVITGARVHATLTGFVNREVTLPVPDIHMTGLGAGPDGITGADLTKKVLGAITSEAIKALATYAAGLGKDVTNAAKNAARGVTTGAGDGVNKMKQGLNSLFGK